MISQSYDQDFFNKKSNEQFDILDKALNITSINNIIQMYKQIVLSLSNVIDNYDPGIQPRFPCESALVRVV